MAKLGLYNVQDGQRGRDGGPYLDAVERQQAELRRAEAENREPDDLSGVLSPTVGTFVVQAALVPDNIYSNPSMASNAGAVSALNDDTFSSNDNLADPIVVVDVPDDDNSDNDNADENEQLEFDFDAENKKPEPKAEDKKPESKAEDKKPESKK